MKSAYLDKMCVHFLELAFLKCYENVIFLFKNSHNKERVPFYLKDNTCVMFGGCLYFLNKALDEVYSKELQSYKPENSKNTLYSSLHSLSLQKHWST